MKKRDRKSFKRLDRAIAELAAVRVGSTVSFAAYEPFRASGPRHAILHLMPDAEANRTFFECTRCGTKERGEWPSPAVAEMVTSTRGIAFLEEHRNCKVPT